MEQEWDFFMLLLVEGSTGAERKEFLGGEGQKEFAPEEMEHIQVCCCYFRGVKRTMKCAISLAVNCNQSTSNICDEANPEIVDALSPLTNERQF